MSTERSVGQDVSNRPRRIVVLGAGFGGVYAFKRLHRWFHNDPSVELILVSDSNYFLFTPLLHEVATGNVEPVNIVEPLRKVLGCCMAEFHLAQVCKVNTGEQTVETTNGGVAYDTLVIALGSGPDFFGVEGAAEHSFTLKTMNDAIRLKNHVIQITEAAQALANGYTPKRYAGASLDELLRIVVVGGGPTGVELAAELADLCNETFRRYYLPELAKQMKIELVHRSDELVPQFADSIRRRSLEKLRAKGVHVRLGTGVSEVRENKAVLDTGEELPSRTVVWTAGVSSKKVPMDIDPETQKGKLIVNEFLQVPAVPSVYAIGDIAAHKDAKTGAVTPALAQSATQQGMYVADTIAREIRGKKQTPFVYRHQGNLLSLGKWRAAGEVNGKVLYGRFAWWLWRTIYLSKLISWSKKGKVAIDWTYNLFRPRDISQLTEIDQQNGCE